MLGHCARPCITLGSYMFVLALGDFLGMSDLSLEMQSDKMCEGEPTRQRDS